MYQAVIYLRRSRSPLVYQTRFEIPGTHHEFNVVRLWEEPTERFLQTPGLLPFAVLTQTNDREAVLRMVGQRVEAISDRRQQSDLAASTSIIAGLVLSKEIIQQVLRQEIMRESVIYQEIEAQGMTKGEASFALRLLKHKFGSLTPELESRISALSLAQLDALANSLLDFSELDDLRTWLDNRA